jgi:hypothetical protein
MSKLSDNLRNLPENRALQDLESVIRDAVTDDSDSEIQWGDQSRAISQLAEMILEQQKRIEALEKALADRNAGEH